MVCSRTHGCKQFIRGKPIRFGFKLWASCTSDGALLHVEPYCGAHTKVPDRGMGHGPNVILEMCEQLKLGNGQHVTFDNYFGTVPLLKELSKKNIAATCTLREDRLSKAPLQKKIIIEKKNRGHIEEAFSDEISLVKWKDNKVVSVASNKLRSFPLQKTNRWNRILKKYVEVNMPNSIHHYNRRMGGVDLFDQQVAAYRIRIRSKKWWWSLFAWNINAQAVNAWMLFRRNGGNVSLLEFNRQIVLSTLKSLGVSRKTPGPKQTYAGPSSEAVRYNGLPHWTKKGEHPNARCKCCGRRTIYLCEMCDIPMHPECMKIYHIQ